MRSPSPRIVDQAVDYYAATVAQDGVSAPSYTYPAIPTAKGLACSAQPGAVEEIDTQGRLVQERQWRLIFPVPRAVNARDLFIHVDRAGVAHKLYAHVGKDLAGRGSAYVVTCTERL